MEKNDNMYYYQKLRKVPEDAKKPIESGRIKGMTDINPMWRINIMTETFGMCGFGWKYEVTKQWNETYGQVVKTYCNINLYVKVNGEWSEPIFGTGGSSFVAIEKSGTYVSDENYKMALTDALSVAMKALGVGADVYWSKGAYDTKYGNPIVQEKNKVKEPEEASDPTLGLGEIEFFKQVVKPAIEQSNSVRELEALFEAYKEICKGVMGYKEAFTARRIAIEKQANG